jgi:hypothetical protein
MGKPPDNYSPRLKRLPEMGSKWISGSLPMRHDGDDTRVSEADILLLLLSFVEEDICNESLYSEDEVFYSVEEMLG